MMMATGAVIYSDSFQESKSIGDYRSRVRRGKQAGMVYGFMVNGGAHEEETKGLDREGGQTPDRREGGDQTRSGRPRQARKTRPAIAASYGRRCEADDPAAAIAAGRSAVADRGAG